MTPVQNARVLFNAIPQGYPEAGTTTYDTSHTIDLENEPLTGGFLVKTLFLSIDPYMRALMGQSQLGKAMKAFQVGQPLVSYGIGKVIRSDTKAVKSGDLLWGVFPMKEYSVQEDVKQFRIVTSEHNLPLPKYLGPLGMPGMTAYSGWKEFSRAKNREVCFVSGGAGAVGSFVCQLAKMDGCKVIASAGSDEKVEFLKSIGVDVAFNYKKNDVNKVLSESGPVDIYWDNVGGSTLDAALEAANTHARFIECGMISGYNSGGAPVTKLMNVLHKQITISGFIVTALEKKYEKDFYSNVPEWIAKGKIHSREEIFPGLQSVGDVLLSVLKGTTQGKAVVQVADD